MPLEASVVFRWQGWWDVMGGASEMWWGVWDVVGCVGCGGVCGMWWDV